MNRPKAVCFTLWFPEHNNPRYVALFPRLSSVVQFCKFQLSRRRLIRALQYRLWHALSRLVIYPSAIRYLGRRYQTLFTVTTDQIPEWPKEKSVIIDLDDPYFTPEEVAALNLPQVKAIVVTTEQAKKLFEEMGVVRPIYVIPQGVAMRQVDAAKRQDSSARFNRQDDVVIGYHAPSLTMTADGSRRTRGDQDDLDFLFAAVEQAREIEPRIKLWLFGDPSEELRKHVSQGRTSWVQLFGYVPFSEMLDRLCDLDIGVYPRTWVPPPGRFSVKIAQFMACGVPVVSTNLDEGSILSEAHAGIVCQSQEDFSRALVELARSPERRAALGRAGKSYAEKKLDWSVLTPVYLELLAE
ncbi:MAG TPA: glycosyltransferase [Candidatus Binatia bacterium]|nr:glycosyltransferase [Candidatus Binatia bacterium]